MILTEKDIGKIFWVECIVEPKFKYIGPGKFVELFAGEEEGDADYDYWFVIVGGTTRHVFYKEEIKYRLSG